MCAVLPCPSLDRSQPLFYFVPQEKDSHSQAGSTSPSLPLMLESKKKTTNITQMPKYGGLQQCTIGFGTFFSGNFGNRQFIARCHGQRANTGISCVTYPEAVMLHLKMCLLLNQS